MGPSGDIMFGPWAAYFPVSLCQGRDIVTLSYPRADIDTGILTVLKSNMQGVDIDSTEIQYAGLGRDIGSISTPCSTVYHGKYAALCLLSNIRPPIL